MILATRRCDTVDPVTAIQRASIDGDPATVAVLVAKPFEDPL
jgi:hypothetical protein